MESLKVKRRKKGRPYERPRWKRPRETKGGDTLVGEGARKNTVVQTRGYSKRNKARGPWPSLIDHLHRQISSVLCDESLFIQQSNNRFRSDFEPPRAECTRGQVPHIYIHGQVAFRKFGDARIAATTCRFPVELPSLSVHVVFPILASSACLFRRILRTMVFYFDWMGKIGRFLTSSVNADKDLLGK